MDIENLSEQEKLKLAACVNPDSSTDAHFTHSPEVEQLLISSMLSDRAFFTQAKTLVEPKYFANQARELICEVLFNYVDKYQSVPPRAVMAHELAETAKKRGKPEGIFLAELNTVYTRYEPHLQNREWLLDVVENFAKLQALKLAYSKTVEIVFSDDLNKWPKVFDILKEPFKISRAKDFGFDYFPRIEDWFLRQKEKKEKMDIFESGFPTIDYSFGDGGGVRGELYGWMGMPGTGKSLLLVKTALANIKMGKKTLFLSLEMDEDKVAKRFHSQLAHVDIHNIMMHEKVVVEQVRHALTETREKYPDIKDDRLLLIKQFPAGTLDVNGLRAFMSQLSNEGFRPDLLVVDYVGEMKDVKGLEVWESRQRLCRDLRALGVELGHCTWTALQPNRSGRDAQKGMGILDDSNIGDSYGQIRVFDGLWSINQDRGEKAMNVGRIFNVKLRDGKSNLVFPVFMDPLTLEISQIDDDKYKEKMSHYKEEKAKDTTIDRKSWKPNPIME